MIILDVVDRKGESLSHGSEGKFFSIPRLVCSKASVALAAGVTENLSYNEFLLDH